MVIGATLLLITFPYWIYQLIAGITVLDYPLLRRCLFFRDPLVFDLLRWWTFEVVKIPENL